MMVPEDLCPTDTLVSLTRLPLSMEKDTGLPDSLAMLAMSLSCSKLAETLNGKPMKQEESLCSTF